MDTEYIVIISVLSVILLLVLIFGILYVVNKHQIALSTNMAGYDNRDKTIDIDHFIRKQNRNPNIIAKRSEESILD